MDWAPNIALSSVFLNDEVETAKRFIDVNVGRSDTDGFTWLLAACYIESTELVSYIIQKGVDINCKATNGRNALHHCIIGCKFKCLNTLMKNGAEVDLLSDGFLPLLMTGYELSKPNIENLISLSSCPRAVKIQALELMGAACVEEFRHLDRARNYWWRSLEERAKAKLRDQVQPKSNKKHPVYGKMKEFRTFKDLMRIPSSTEDMHMQALIVRERIFGVHDPKMFPYIISKASAYLTAGNFNRCVQLLRYSLIMPRKVFGRLNTLKIFHAMIDVLSQPSTDKDNCLNVFIGCVDVMELILGPKKGTEVIEYPACRFTEFLELFVKYIGHLIQHLSTMSEEDIKKVHQSVCNLVNVNPCDNDNRQLLHFACRISDTSFPLYYVVQQLLKAGAIPQGVDEDGNTPLHWLALNLHPSKQRVIKLLMSKFCFCVLNIRNKEGKCFTDYLTSGIIGRDSKQLSDVLQLQCLSAKTVARYKIPHHSILPSHLSELVKMHVSV